MPTVGPSRLPARPGGRWFASFIMVGGLAATVVACGEDANGDQAGPTAHLAPDQVAANFRDSTAALGLDAVGPVEQCLAPADLDGDGLEDLLLWRDGGPVVFRRLPGGGFEEAAVSVTGAEPGTAFVRTLVCTAADLDGDGRRDIVAAGLGDHVEVLWATGRLQYERSVLALEGDTFPGDPPLETDAGIAPYTSGVTLLDVNGDGRLDLYVTRGTPGSLATAFEPVSQFIGMGGVHNCCDVTEGDTWYCCAPECGAPPDGERPFVYSPGPRNQLLLQSSAREFTDASTAARVNALVSTWVATVIDANEDTLPDLLLANDFAPNDVLLADGAGAFDTAARTDPALSYLNHAMGVTLADIDADGHIDAAMSQIGLPRFLFGDGAGGFVERYPADGVHDLPGRPLSWGLTFLDVDLDGDSDLYLGNQYLGPDLDCWASAGAGITHGLADEAPQRTIDAQANLLYLNEGGQFTVVPHAPPIGDYRGTMVVTAADVDGDADDDLLALEFRTGPKDRMYLRVWENTFADNGRIRVTLPGASGDAIVPGTRASVKAGDRVQTFMLGGPDGYAAQRSRSLSVGIGGSRRAFVRLALPGEPFDAGRWVRAGETVAVEE